MGLEIKVNPKTIVEKIEVMEAYHELFKIPYFYYPVGYYITFPFSKEETIFCDSDDEFYKKSDAKEMSVNEFIKYCEGK